MEATLELGGGIGAGVSLRSVHMANSEHVLFEIIPLQSSSLKYYWFDSKDF